MEIVSRNVEIISVPCKFCTASCLTLNCALYMVSPASVSVDPGGVKARMAVYTAATQRKAGKNKIG